MILVSGERIKSLRETKGYNLSEFAAKIEIDKSYLSNLENGKKNNPSRQVLQKIADGLGVEIDELLGVSIQEKPKQFIEDIIRSLIEQGSIIDENNIDDLAMDIINSTVKLEIKRIISENNKQ